MSEIKQYLYRIQPARPEMLTGGATPEEQHATSLHSDYRQELLAAGALVLAGRTQNTDETSFGIVIFEAESDEAANEIMLNDPVVKLGVMNAWLFPYGVALMRQGW